MFKKFKMCWYIFFNKRKLAKEKQKRYNIKTSTETVNAIISGKSISRYGDGELSCILNSKDLLFQKHNEKMAVKLKEVLVSNLDNLLIAIPGPLVTIENLTTKEAYFWSRYYLKYSDKLATILNPEKVYYDTMTTRFYLPYIDKRENIANIERLRDFFENKNILIVEGENTRFGLGNNLLKKVKSIKRILAPSRDAFLLCDKILNEVCNFPKNTIVLLALGPTATILAYELCKKGYQAIDIGHLDIEYEWYLAGAKKKIAVKYKDVSEVEFLKDNNIDDTSIKEEYEKQIWCKCLK